MASQQQSRLQQYFQSFGNTDRNTVSGADTPQVSLAGDTSRDGLKRSAEDEAKENRPPESTSRGAKKQTKAGASGSKPHSKQSKQLFLDLGQKDFSASRCSVCGMVYAKGQEEDEKLHKSFHQSAVQGLKFQGWGQERVLLSDPFSGRLLMIMPTDPAAHVKRAHEVCNFVERGHGITAGWLMSSQQCKVFLFVSLQKRVVGLAVVEPIKQAYRVAAACPTDEEADSSQHAQRQQQQQPQQSTFLQHYQHESQQQLTIQQQQRPLLWPGLHRGSGRKAGAGSGGKFGSMLLSGGGTAADSNTTAGGSNTVKADSCPASLLAAAEHMQMGSVLTPADSMQQQQLQSGLEDDHHSSLLQTASGSSACLGPARAALQQAFAGQSTTLQHSSGQDSLHQQQQQQQQERIDMPPPPPQPSGAAAGGRSGTSSRALAGGNSSSSFQLAGNSGQGAGCSGRSAMGLKGAGSGGGRSVSRSVRSAEVSGVSGGSSSCIIADKSKAMRAMLGVRVVWVSAEQRRSGLATKLLDAARCNMIPGYVVPRNQLAFMQPTEDGSKLAASFTGTQQFLVYGVE